MKLTQLLLGFTSVWLVGCTTPNKDLQQKLKTSVGMLQSLAFDAQQENLKIIEGLEGEVKAEGNSRMGFEAIKRAQGLQNKTSKLCNSLSHWQGLIHKDASNAQVRKVLLGKEGKKLINTLDAYVQWVNTEFKDLYLPPLTKFSQPHFQRNVKVPHNTDEFLAFHFKNTTATGVHTWFAQTRLHILAYTQQVLHKLREGDSINRFRHLNIQIAATENTPIIKLGETYQADLCIANVASRTQPRMTLNGQPIPTSDSIANVSIQAAPIADSVPAHVDKVTRYWQGSITFKNRGRDTTIYLKKPYTVLRKSVYGTQKR